MVSEIVQLAQPDGNVRLDIPIEATANSPGEGSAREPVAARMTSTEKQVSKGSEVVRPTEERGTEQEVVVMAADAGNAAVVAVEVGGDSNVFRDVNGWLALPNRSYSRLVTDCRDSRVSKNSPRRHLTWIYLGRRLERLPRCQEQTYQAVFACREVLQDSWLCQTGGARYELLPEIGDLPHDGNDSAPGRDVIARDLGPHARRPGFSGALSTKRAPCDVRFYLHVLSVH